jgi:hypothetical protein
MRGYRSRTRQPVRTARVRTLRLSRPWLLLPLLALGWTTAALAAAEPAGLTLSQLDVWLASIPAWAFVLAFVVLPALGFPMSLFYLTIGGVFAPSALALSVAWGCMALNMALSYAVARALAGPVERLLRRRGYPLPHLEAGSQWRAIVLLRASPLPWLMQSWLLTLGGARFLPYMVFGLPVQALVGAGLVLVGESLFQGSLGWLAGGVVVVLLAQLLLGTLRRRLREDTGIA